MDLQIDRALLLALLGLSACSDRATADGSESGDSSSTSSGESEASSTGDEPTMLLHAQQLAVGVSHSCALLHDGTVACWGAGELGTLGDGSSGDGHSRWRPQRVPGLAGVVEVVALWNQTCALVDDGTVRCWGDGARGQLGNGRSGEDVIEASPVIVSDLDDAVHLAVGPRNVCAIRASGDVVCWGAADDAMFGVTAPDCGPYILQRDTPMEYYAPCQSTPATVPGLHEVVDLAVGATMVCATLGDGRVQCIGAHDEVGQLGDGDTGMPMSPPVPVDVVGLVAPLALRVGEQGACALQTDATVACWGGNTFGQLGLELDDLEHVDVPTTITSLAGVDALVVADDTVCAVAAGDPWCWGDVNYVFEVEPVPGSAAVAHPTLLPQPRDIVELATGGFHSCARFADDTVTCWGPSDTGQLGIDADDVLDFGFALVRWDG